MKKNVGIIVLALALAIGTLFAETPTIATAAAKPVLSKKSVKLVVGKSEKITVKKAKTNVKWASSNSKVCTVAGSGKKKATGTITGKGVGKATITATVAKKKLTCSVEVVKYIVRNKLSECSTGDVVYFGEYEQDNDKTNGKEPIAWYVMGEGNESLLLFSVCNLEKKEFNSGFGAITWDASELRKWLNGTFYDEAFSSTEKNKIFTTILTNPANPFYRVGLGKITEDKVFIPAYDDLKGLFSNYMAMTDSWEAVANERIRALNTAYSYNKGIDQYNSETGKEGKSEYGTAFDPEATGKYWLRTNGSTDGTVMYADALGEVNTEGQGAYADKTGVRPVIIVNKY